LALPALLEAPAEEKQETLGDRRVVCSTWPLDPPVALLYFRPVARFQRWFDPAQSRCVQEGGWASTGERVFLTVFDDFADGPGGKPVPLRAETTVDPVDVPAFGQGEEGQEVEGRLPMAGRRILEFFQTLPPGVVVLREFQVYHENGTLLCQALCHDYIINGGVAPDEFEPETDRP
jgi:hypothetical protein